LKSQRGGAGNADGFFHGFVRSIAACSRTWFSHGGDARPVALWPSDAATRAALGQRGGQIATTSIIGIISTVLFRW